MTGPPPGPIALDDTRVYFGTSKANAEGSVMAVPKGGGDVVTLAQGQGFIVSLAVDAQFVYWAENSDTNALGYVGGPLKIAPKAGGTSTVLVDEAMGLALDATSLYYWRSGGSLEKMPLGGGVPVVLATGVSTTGIRDLAVGGASLYWVDLDDAIYRLPVDGGTPSLIVSAPPPPLNGGRSLALDSSSLYWLGNDGPYAPSLELWRAMPDGSGQSLLFTGTKYPSDFLAVDATGAYVSNFVWTDDGASIERVPLTGGAATRLALGPAMQTPPIAAVVVHGFALDASYVYWTSLQGYVGRTAK